jgi:predicted small secreted protein
MLTRLLFIGCLAAAITLQGCRTMEGLGQDVSRLGDKISSKAREKAN